MGKQNIMRPQLKEERFIFKGNKKDIELVCLNFKKAILK